MDKSRLKSIKDELELLTSKYDESLNEISEREKKMQEMDAKSKEILSTKENELVKLNIGGTIFQTRISTLLREPDSLFHKIFQNSTNLNEIFIDRSPEIFTHILDFLRTGRLNTKRLKQQLIYDDYIEEAKFYGVYSISNASEKQIKLATKVEMINLEVSAYYENTGGNIDVLKTRDLNRGILTDAPGVMIIEFRDVVDFEEFEVGGYTGDGAWINSTGYGAGGAIYTSVDKAQWEVVGSLPYNFGDTIVKAKVKRSMAKYLKLTSADWLAISYIEVFSIINE